MAFDDARDELLRDEVLQQAEELSLRRALERDKRIATDVTRELSDGGPLLLYLKTRREEARQAYRDIAEADPSDTARIIALQALIREYVRVIEWVDERLQTGAKAEHVLENAQDDEPRYTHEDY